MAFKKGPAQAQKVGPKGAQAGRRAPPQKTPQAAKAEDDDEDLDEEDEEDLDFNEESDLSGADEDLDDEELDDEELDDEELDDEEDDEEAEELPAGKAAVKVQEQKTPAKQAQAQKTENGKRKAEDDAGSSPSKKVKLEDHIPASFVVDYEARDVCDVKLSGFAEGVTVNDIKGVCKGASEVRDKLVKKKLTCAFVRYPTKEKAVAAVQALQGTKLKGASFEVSYCGDRWNDPSQRPQYLPNTLDVRRLPKKFTNKEKLAAFFPTGQVLKVFPDGYAQVKFPSTEELVKVLKNPKCRTVDGNNLQFAAAVLYTDKPTKAHFTVAKKGQNKSAKKSPGKGQSPGKKPGTPAPKDSPKTSGQQQKSPKTPGQAKGGPKTPKATPKGTPKGILKATPKGTPKATPKGTPFQKKTPGIKGTPAKA